MLVLNTVLLLAARRSILDGTSSSLVAATAFLHRDYHPECFYWELIELARRTFLTGWVLLIEETSSFIRILIGLMVNVAVLMLTLTRSPYRHNEDQFLAVCAQLMLVVSFVGTLVVKAYEDVDARAEQRGVYGEAAAVFGFASSHALVDMLIVFTILMIFPCLVATLTFNVVQAARAQRRAAAAERKAAAARGRMSHPPTCDWTMKDGNRYLTFFSHYKVEAGSDARCIASWFSNPAPAEDPRSATHKPWAPHRKQT